MKNEFKDNRLNLLAQYCDKAYKWVEKAAQDEVELRKEENSLGIAICQLHNMADAAHEVLPVNSTIGVFGASQAGKSYLVSALASNG
ncbi:MAG: virulence factor SrfC family protein, partial [Succinivibrio dextrinosolvens]|nr:virulence factor SrfC family protein [Succinivibrio dextrinosolvens]